MARPSQVEIAKAGMTSTTVASAASLNPQQFDYFWQLVTEVPTLVSDVQTQIMDALKCYVESMEFGAPITFRATEGAEPTSDETSAMTPSRVELDAQEIQCETSLTDRLRKSIIIRQRVDDYVRTKMAARHALDLEHLIVNGSTALSSDKLLKTFNGILVQSSTNAIDYTDDPQQVTDDVFYRAWLALPAKYRMDKSNLRFYCNSDVTAAYNKYLSARETSVGDIRIIDGTQQTFWNGVLLKEVSCFPEGTTLLCNRNNIVIGRLMDATAYTWEAPRAATTYYGIRYYGDVKYVEEEGSVKTEGLDPTLLTATSS